MWIPGWVIWVVLGWPVIAAIIVLGMLVFGSNAKRPETDEYPIPKNHG